MKSELEFWSQSVVRVFACSAIHLCGEQVNTMTQYEACNEFMFKDNNKTSVASLCLIN